jgi:hypothetical protein
MTNATYQFDLVVLTADKNMQSAVAGLLNRRQSLGLRRIQSEFFVHPERDPGCLLRAQAFLRPSVNRCAHALVVFDRQGCGKEQSTREELGNEVFASLSQSGWKDRAAVVVIDPELENWVFSDSPEVDEALGWENRAPSLRFWLEEKAFLSAGQTKPPRPKEAMEAALRHVRLPRSSSIYAQLAERVGLERCIDPAFIRLKEVLQSWFSAGDEKMPTRQ